MGNFIINTPYHKRWWLPDSIHQLNSVIFGDDLRLCVIHSLTGEQTEIVTIKLDAEGKWKDTSALYQELANKKYKPQLRHKSISHERKKAGF